MIGKKIFDTKTKSFWIIKEATLKGVVMVSEDGTMTRKTSYENFWDRVTDKTLYEVKE